VGPELRSIMVRHYNALITWSNEHMRVGLPATSESVDPAWFIEQGERSGEGWSLRCRFEPPPNVQGNPTRAVVRFTVGQAPDLKPGAVMHLFERATGTYAVLEILD
jgi:hypothetical protein